MTQRKSGIFKKKGYHPKGGKYRKNSGIWNRLVHHHNKSCTKGTQNCKLTRLKAKYHRLKCKKENVPVVELHTYRETTPVGVNLFSYDTSPLRLKEETSLGRGKIEEIIDLINISSTLPTGKYSKSDRLFDSRGEFIARSYSCPARNFESLNTNSEPFQTVIKKKIPMQNSNNFLTKENISKAKNDFYKTAGTNTMSKRPKNIHNHRQAQRKPIGKTVQQNRRHRHSPLRVRHVSPGPPPKNPIKGSSKAWELLDGYDKFCREKRKAAGWGTLDEPLKNFQDTFF